MNAFGGKKDFTKNTQKVPFPIRFLCFGRCPKVHLKYPLLKFAYLYQPRPFVSFRRWRRTSYMATPPATDAFNELTA